MSQGQRKVSYGLLRWPFASLPSGSHLSVLGSRCQRICLHFPRLGKFRKIKGVPVFFPIVFLGFVGKSSLRSFNSLYRRVMEGYQIREKKLVIICKRVNKNENTSQDISNKSKYFKQISKHLSGKKRKQPFCPSQKSKIFQQISKHAQKCYMQAEQWSVWLWLWVLQKNHLSSVPRLCAVSSMSVVNPKICLLPTKMIWIDNKWKMKRMKR